MLWTLSGLIETETPTAEKARLDELGTWMATWAQDLGAETIIHREAKVGNIVECRWHHTSTTKPIVICCHMDTVHPLGSIDQRPTRTEGDYLFGVGAYDMKGGITVAQTVIQDLIERNTMPKRPLTLLLTSDEEVGSPQSRPVIETICKDAALVLVMEPGPAKDTIVSERKGVGIFTMIALGRASHAGSNPDAGINAIEEMAHQISNITALSQRELGTTVIPTIIQGGTKHNVIPDECQLTINVRVRYRREADRVLHALQAVSHQANHADALLYLTGDFKRPPMEHDDIMATTVATLQRIAPFTIEEFSKGGGSDGNFTAAMGVPTLDGLGPTGGGAHSDDERVYIPSIPRRAALLAAILREWPTS